MTDIRKTGRFYCLPHAREFELHVECGDVIFGSVSKKILAETLKQLNGGSLCACLLRDEPPELLSIKAVKQFSGNEIMQYYDWKPIGAERAQRALDNGGNIWSLPTQFGNGQVRYVCGLETRRGANYVVSDRTLAALTIPEAALPPVKNTISPANHRSPFGPGA